MNEDCDNLMMHNFTNDLGYRGVGDKSSKRRSSLLKDLPKKLPKLKIEMQTKKNMMIYKVED